MFMNTAVCRARIGPCIGRLHIMLYWTVLIQLSLTGAHIIIAAILISVVPAIIGDGVVYSISSI